MVQSIVCFYNVNAAFASASAPSFVLFPVASISFRFLSVRETLDQVLTTNKSRSVYEDAAIDACRLRQVIVAQSPPRFWERFPALETLRCHGDGLDAPIPASLIWVDDVVRLRILRYRLFGLDLEKMLLRSEMMSWILQKRGSNAGH